MPLYFGPGPTAMASAISRTWTSLEGVDADLYDQLLDLHAVWQANPAQPFADGEDGDLLDIYLDFERYRDCLSRCLIYADLRSRRRRRILKAVTRLESLVQLDATDEQSWELLYRARGSLPGRNAALASLLGRIQEQFPAGIPG